jgi:hypothetical protein
VRFLGVLVSRGGSGVGQDRGSRGFLLELMIPPHYRLGSTVVVRPSRFGVVPGSIPGLAILFSSYSSQVGQMVLARGLRSAGFRAPDDLYLLYVRKIVTTIEPLPRLKRSLQTETNPKLGKIINSPNRLISPNRSPNRTSILIISNWPGASTYRTQW